MQFRFLRWLYVILIIFLSLGCRLSDNKIRGTIGSEDSGSEENSPNPVNISVSLIESYLTNDAVLVSVQFTDASDNIKVFLSQGSATDSCSEPSLNDQYIQANGELLFNSLTPNSSYKIIACVNNNFLKSLSITTYNSYCDSPWRIANMPFANSNESNVDGLTWPTAFTICNFNQLNSVSTNNDKHIILMNDIDFTGESWNGISQFFGKFDGNFKVLDNINPNALTILFGTLKTGAEVKNVRIENLNFSQSVAFQIGAIAGAMEPGSTLDTSSAQGTIQIVTGLSFSLIGGLVGYGRGDVSNSISMVDINITSSTYGGNSIGGLIGQNSGTLSNSYVNANLSVNITAPGVYAFYTGGIVGNNDGASGYGTISNSFKIGNVTGDTNTGLVDLTYVLNNGGTASGVYYHSTALCTNVGGGSCLKSGTGSAAMSYFYDSTNAPLNAWNFTSTWIENLGVSFPSLW